MDNNNKKINAILILPIFKNIKNRDLLFFEKSNLASREYEAKNLVSSLNLNLINSIIVSINFINPSTLFSQFALNDLKNKLPENEMSLIIIDGKLSPIQQRNLENFFKSKVIDRTQLIIEIFASRALSKEGKLQVELASLNFQKTRLVRSWTHLERQRGGAGFMGGPGERQIELDKRMINKKIKNIKQSLQKIILTRNIQKRYRDKSSRPFISLVGYTNSGKSTLFNKLTNSNVLAKNMPFATLDPTMRTFSTRHNPELKFIVSDTVGFISALPIELIKAFHSTLEYLLHSDILLFVHDASDHKIEERSEEVFKTLRIIGIEETFLKNKVIHVFNKMDLLRDNYYVEIYKHYKNKLFISALNKKDVNRLKNFVFNFIYQLS